MARKLKPQKVGTVDDGKVGVSVDLYLDRNKLIFYGEVGGRTIKHISADDCKALIKAAIRELAELDWFGVIEVRKIRSIRMDASLIGHCGYKIRRFWVAEREQVDGWSYIQTYWDMSTEEARINNSRSFHWPHPQAFKLPFCDKVDREAKMVAYLEHSDELWSGLSTMLEGLNNLTRYLDGQIDSPDSSGLEWLAGLGEDKDWIFSISEA